MSCPLRQCPAPPEPWGPPRWFPPPGPRAAGSLRTPQACGAEQATAASSQPRLLTARLVTRETRLVGHGCQTVVPPGDRASDASGQDAPPDAWEGVRGHRARPGQRPEWTFGRGGFRPHGGSVDGSLRMSRRGAGRESDVELRRDRRGLLAAHGGAKMRFRWAGPGPGDGEGSRGPRDGGGRAVAGGRGQTRTATDAVQRVKRPDQRRELQRPRSPGRVTQRSRPHCCPAWSRHISRPSGPSVTASRPAQRCPRAPPPGATPCHHPPLPPVTHIFLFSAWCPSRANAAATGTQWPWPPAYPPTRADSSGQQSLPNRWIRSPVPASD